MTLKERVFGTRRREDLPGEPQGDPGTQVLPSTPDRPSVHGRAMRYAEAGGTSDGAAMRDASREPHTHTDLRFVFFGKPGGICVWRVGNRDVDIVRLHLQVANSLGSK